MRWALVIWLLALALGGIVGTAGAAGAWVLWVSGGDAESTYTKNQQAAFDTRDQCMASVRNRWVPAVYNGPDERLQPLDSGAVVWFPAGADKDGKQRYQFLRFECWPDTVKP